MTLFRREPNLYWAHPYSLILFDIPITVSMAEIRESLLTCLSARHTLGTSDVQLDILSAPSASEGGIWKAVASLSDKDMYSYILGKMKSVEGIELS